MTKIDIMLDSFPVGILSLKRDGQITFISKKASEILGIRLDKKKKLFIMDLIPEEFKERYTKRFYEIVNGYKLNPQEYYYQKEDGSYKCLHLDAGVIKNKKGEIESINIILNDISELKYKSGIHSESFLKNDIILDVIEDGIVTRDVSGRIIYFNKRICEIFAVTNLEMEREKVQGYIPQSDITKIRNAVTQILDKKEKNIQIEYSAQNSRGDLLWLSTRIAPVYDSSNNIIAIHSITKDITSKRDVELELVKSQKKLKSVFESANDAIFLLKESRITEANPATAEIFGYSIEEIIGKSIEELSPEMQKDEEPTELKVKRTLNRLITENKIRMEWLHRKKDGSLFDVEISLNLLKTGNEQYTQAVVRDITERKLAEEKLRKNVERYNTIINVTQTGTWEFYSKSNYVWCSEVYFDILGLDPGKFDMSGKENINQVWIDFLHPEDRDKAITQFRKYLNEGSKGMYENIFRMRHNDGSWRWILSRGQTLKKSDGSSSEIIAGTHIDITQEKLIEENLRKNEELLSKVIATIPDLLVLTDLDGNIIYINDIQIPFMNNYPSKKLLGKKYYELISEIDRERAIKNFSLLLEHQIGGQEYKLVFKGIEVICEVKGDVIRDNNGKPVEMVFLVRDVTEKKKSVEQLKISNDNFKRIFEESPFGMSITRIQENPHLLAVNKAYARIYKKYIDELVGQQIFNLISPEQNKRLRAEYKRTGELKNYEMIKEINGEKKYFIFNSQIIRYNDEDCLLNVMQDDTERKNAEIALKVTLERLNFIIELIPDALFILDRDDKIIAWNKAMEQLTGVKKEKVLGKGNFTHSYALYKNRVPILIDLLKPEFAGYENQYEYVIREGDKVYAESYDKSIGKGRGRHLWGVATWLYDDTGNRFGSIELIRDITVIKKRENELQKYRDHLEDLIKERTTELEKVNKLLEKEILKQKKAEEKVKEALIKEKELNELKTRFISIASHEFRTPLTTIYSSVQLLEKYGHKWTQEMYKSQFNRIKEYVHHMTRIMDDVLTISRTDAGKIQFQPRELNLIDFIKSIIEDIKTVITSKHKLVYTKKIKSELYLFDEKLLKQILLNLLTNAVKYSPDGGEIKFSLSEGVNYMKFVIADKGIGIPEEDQKDLFEPFHRSANVGDIQGTGLGMSIIKKSVDLHSGKITFKSKINKGTEFTIHIPLRYKYEKKNTGN